MDEAHVMKDKNSYRWKNLMSVAKNARQRLMLTGTPLQNDLHVCFFSWSFECLFLIHEEMVLSVLINNLRKYWDRNS